MKLAIICELLAADIMIFAALTTPGKEVEYLILACLFFMLALILHQIEHKKADTSMPYARYTGRSWLDV